MKNILVTVLVSIISTASFASPNKVRLYYCGDKTLGIDITHVKGKKNLIADLYAFSNESTEGVDIEPLISIEVKKTEILSAGMVTFKGVSKKSFNLDMKLAPVEKGLRLYHPARLNVNLKEVVGNNRRLECQSDN